MTSRRASSILPAVGLSVVVVASCIGLPAPATPAATPVSSSAPAASAAPSATSSSSTARPSPTTTAELLPISGVWRVRKVLHPEDRSQLIEDPSFEEETYTVEAGCAEEPCESVMVTTTPLGLTAPATTVDLTRDGARYRSTAQPDESSTCISAFGDRVDGGATTTSTLELWVATDRPAGSSVATTAIHGAIELDIRPTSIGEAAGCERQTAAFDLTGRREAVAVRNPDGTPAGPDIRPPSSAALVALPSLSADIPGATVKYFPISGDTSIELASSIARAGVKACGEIDYEWYRGDARPSACAITRVSDTRQSIRISTSASGSCRITDADIRATYTVHLPRWTEPSRVPKRLLDWWRRIVDFIADHEAGHVRIGRDHIGRLNDRLVGKPCEQLAQIVRTWAGQHAEAQEAYDRREYSRPWPEPPRGY